MHCKRVVEQAMTEDFLSKGLGEGYGLRCRGEMDDYLRNPGSIGGHLGNVGWHDSAGTTKRGRR